MLKINFLPESDLFDFTEAVKEYEKIWNDDGVKIISVWKNVTGLQFKENFINAIVFKGVSFSHLLNLKYNADNATKKAHLVHELGHRILSGVIERKWKDSLESHKVLDLLLYDVFEDLYGKDFADTQVKYDKSKDFQPEVYITAWDWALQFKTREERQKKFKEILETKIVE